MANLIQATVYQIDGSPLPSSVTIDFQTSNLAIREAAINIAEVNSAILYYNVPNNPLSVQTFYVSETVSDLVDAANVGTTTQVQATVLEINEDPQVPGGVQYSFPANEILVGESVNAVTGVNSYIQFKNVKYFASELQSDLLVSGNGASAYKVYTALLTQSGGDNPTSDDNFSLTVGVTYTIGDFGGPYTLGDFTNVGAPDNNIGTSFVATGTTPNSWGIGIQLFYNTGAPVVTVLENTIGNIWFTYDSVGTYLVNSNSLFTNSKSMSLIGSTFSGVQNGGLAGVNAAGDSLFYIYTSLNLATSDDELYNTPIEIRVYN
jgi:hypothetical protein